MRKLNKILLGVFFCAISFAFISNVKALSYKNYNVGDEIKFNPILGEICSDEKDKNCYTFNVINPNKNDKYIEIMLNKNIISDSTFGDSTNGPTVALNELKEATKAWNGVKKYSNIDNVVEMTGKNTNYTVDYSGSNARMISMNEISNLLGFEWEYSSNTIYKNSYNDYKSFRWLSSNLDSNNNDFGYWTSSSRGDISNEFWYVTNVAGSSGFEYGSHDPSFKIGVRPVVMIEKEKKDISSSEEEKDISSSEDEKNKVDTNKTTTKENLNKVDDNEINFDDSPKKDNKNTEVKNPSTGDAIILTIALLIASGAAFMVTYKKAK